MKKYHHACDPVASEPHVPRYLTNPTVRVKKTTIPMEGSSSVTLVSEIFRSASHDTVRSTRSNRTLFACRGAEDEENVSEKEEKVTHLVCSPIPAVPSEFYPDNRCGIPGGCARSWGAPGVLSLFSVNGRRIVSGRLEACDQHF